MDGPHRRAQPGLAEGRLPLVEQAEQLLGRDRIERVAELVAAGKSFHP